MATIHVPSDAMHQTVENSQPGDELIFDAGHYVFDETLHIRKDRYYQIIDQEIEPSDLFQADWLFEIEEQSECYCISLCRISLKEKCGFALLLGCNSTGIIDSNVLEGMHFTNS